MKKLDPAVEQRFFRNVFVCKKCKSKIRALPTKIKEGKVKCRKCGSTYFRPKKLIKLLTTK